MLRSVLLRVSSKPWVESFVRKSRFTKGVVRRFIAGDRLEDALEVGSELIHRGFKVTLDQLGEEVKQESEADMALDEYMRILEAIRVSGLSGGIAPENINISIKLTQLGLSTGVARTRERLESLVFSAKQSDNFVRVDMEGSAYTDQTLSLSYDVHSICDRVGIALQSMLRRTENDVREANRRKIRVRLIKGAYLEPVSIAYRTKREIDEAYFSQACELLKNGYFPAFATHDHRLISRIAHYAQSLKIPKDRYEFQLLFGIRRDLQLKLLREGHYVRIYVPYGTNWYGYFMRRLAERPANLFFFIRSLFSK